jgi:putative endonuclease
MELLPTIGAVGGRCMSTVEAGRAAEQLAARWLEQHGFRILDRNWRTRWCELDIVAARDRLIHIVEVKYRRRTDFGTGFEYITPDKAARLRRAALMWLKAHGQASAAYQIDIMALSGSLKPENLAYLPNAIDDL